jgi:hypothetical protein
MGSISGLWGVESIISLGSHASPARHSDVNEIMKSEDVRVVKGRRLRRYGGKG